MVRVDDMLVADVPVVSRVVGAHLKLEAGAVLRKRGSEVQRAKTRDLYAVTILETGLDLERN